MSYEGLLHLVYQLGLIIAGLLIASLAMRFRIIMLQWIGGFISAIAAIWAAWEGMDQFYLIAKPFEEKWLGLCQVFAVLLAAALILVIVIFATGRPELTGERTS